MRKTIEYAINKEDGHIISRVGGAVAIPVLEYEQMNIFNGFEAKYRLEKFNLFSIVSTYPAYIWTRKIPVEIKNEHRKFWGMRGVK
jgi:hypothetical protein